LRLTALVKSAEHVCCRYRLAAFRPYLEAAGHRLELRPLPRRLSEWLWLRQDLTGSEAVIVQRKLLPSWQLYLLRRACRFLIFDFDDAVFLRDSYSPKGLVSHRRRRRFASMVRTADAIVAGNDFLFREATSLGAVRCGEVIPTCVDPRRYVAIEKDTSDLRCRLVWIGSSSTLRSLETMRPLLEKLGELVPGLSLKVVADRTIQLRRLPVVSCAWSEDTEAEALASADVGISWMPDDDWSRGKCGLKVLQYMAAGLPVVANPVGVHQTIIVDGATGFLASTEVKWLQVVSLLAKSPDLRRRMGLGGRRRVESEFSVHVGAERWLRLIDRLPQGRLLAA